MYPFIRLLKEILKCRSAPRLGLADAHVSTHVCWPWDLDPWMELNNGRTLTLFDLGRIPFGHRIGLAAAMQANGWRVTVAGASVRYRKRVRPFDRLDMVTRALGWDERFIYIEQSMWRGAECTSHMLLRLAVIDANGIVGPQRVISAMGSHAPSPALPEWVRAWVEADAERPWPPQREGMDPN